MKKIYALLLTSVVTLSLFAGTCSTLFFSEYLEGSGNNKALEIYNPTSAAVNTTGYRVVLFANGSTNPSVTFYLNAVIAPGDVYVIMNSTANATLLALADTVSGVATFTGNDAVALLHGIDTLDVIGIIGDNPSAAWAVDTFTTGTTNHTLVRNSTNPTGTKSWALSTGQWAVLDSSLNQLGAHTGPTGQFLCSASPYDTIVNFSPTSGSFSGVNGQASLSLELNVTHTSSLSVDVEILSGNAAWINNYTTQTVSFGANVTSKTLALTITNDTAGQLSHVVTFRLTNPQNGLVIGTSNIYTLTLNPFAAVDTCGSLFFSEYLEGSSNNKALEIYNPTNAAVVLDGYKVKLFTGGGTSTSTFNLTGTLNAGDVYVIVNSQADSTLKLLADTVTGGVTGFNGDDAVALINGSDTIDVIGVIGVDPGTSWTVDTGTTQNHTLVRNSLVKSGTKSWPVATTQWNAFGVDFNQLGAHTGPVNITACVVYSGINQVEASNNIARVYPNPNNGKFVIELQNAIAAEIRLFDMTGQLVYTSKETSSNLVSIDATNLSAGMYLAEIKTGNQISRSRISVQH